MIINIIKRLFSKSQEDALTCDPLGFKDGKCVILSEGLGFLTQTTKARKPRRGEERCRNCGGDGWDADCGGVFICPDCKGYGVVALKEVKDE